MAKYVDKHHWDVHLNVGDLVYVSTANFFWQASYFTRLSHLGLDLSLLVTLSLVLYFVFSCLLSMDVCTPCSMLVISGPTWAQHPPYL